MLDKEMNVLTSIHEYLEQWRDDGFSDINLALDKGLIEYAASLLHNAGLTDQGINWGRKDANHIWVATSGYKSGAHHAIGEILMGYKIVMMDEEFDKISGKTFAIYKHN